MKKTFTRIAGILMILCLLCCLAACDTEDTRHDRDKDETEERQTQKATSEETQAKEPAPEETQVKEATPEDTVQAFCKALTSYDTEEMTALATEFPDGKELGVTYNMFSDEEYVTLYRSSYKSSEYDITDAKEEGDIATVTLKVSHTDLPSLYSEAMVQAMATIFADEELYALVMNDPDADISYLVPQTMSELLSSAKTVTSTYTLSLVKAEDEWCIQTDEQLKNLISADLYQTVQKVSLGIE